MSAAEAVYYVIAVVAILSALGVVLAGNIVHAAIFFILALGGIAGFYLMLSVELGRITTVWGAVLMILCVSLALAQSHPCAVNACP